ncbi:MAG: hypothetical protein A2W68_18415 [Betaproteobacteria bacterium RIFCSPLOWO2_02_64_14]|nr:MAG: hypothetical protein A2W68_18415 [Betaproteobacteria bacterium RIFCSPLOWO2_02_64_14]
MAAKSAKPRSLQNITVKKFIDDYLYRIDLDADYQREKIWSIKQQEDLLDSIVKDIDIPKIYLVEVQDNKQFDYECIDGKQRMASLSRFFKPGTDEESPLTVRILERQYTYRQLKKEHPSIARQIERYKLSFCIYESIDDEYIREIFRRLQLGIRLNSGELLKTRTGTLRDFIYKDIGNNGPFLRHTNLSEKRFSRPFTLAQICINSFARAEPENDFVRARLQDIELFFEENHDLDRKDKNLTRIERVLKLMDKAFGKNAGVISSRAIAVSGYLFVEELVKNEKADRVPEFSQFYVKLLGEIKHNTDLLSKYEKPRNPSLMEEFQKYVLQASVEGYSIKRRHEYLKMAFDYYLDPKTNGKIIGGK